MNSPSPTHVIDDLLAASQRLGNPLAPSGDTLVGLFQSFRPDGIPAETLLEDYAGGGEVYDRLQQVFEATCNVKRSDGMLDAYFIVRRPPPISSADAQRLGERFSAAFVVACRNLLPAEPWFNAPVPVRVLEGKAPKHPRDDAERSGILRAFDKGLPAAIEQLFRPNSLGARLSEPLYFMACDAFLRDYLRWPLMMTDANSNEGAEVFESYFELWRHGIKIRAFSDDQLDLYIPR